MGNGLSRQITKKCGTKYENGNYILGHKIWKWVTIFWDRESITKGKIVRWQS